LFREFGEDLGEILSNSITEEHTPGLRMSNIGRPLRQLWYETHPDVVQSEPVSGSSLLKFSYGHILEALVVVLAKAGGHTVERQQEEVSVDGISGHIDCVIDNVLVDIKSASPYSFSKFVSGEILSGNDPFGYLGQICGYAHALGLPAAWIVVNKVSGEICILHVPQELIDGYNVRSRVTEVRQAIAGLDEPERCYPDENVNKSGNRKLGISCSYCPWKFHCWRDSNEGRGLQVYNYARGLVYYTHVAKEPKVDIVEYESFKIKGDHN
jgi:hypothetical protein